MTTYFRELESQSGVGGVGARAHCIVQYGCYCFAISLEQVLKPMILGGRSLGDISLDDIRLLIDNSVPEGPHLDYKEAPYSNRGQDRREMLRDVAALANSEGGYLVVGIREDYADRAAELTPFDNPGQVAQAMRQSCLDGIRDRIEGLEIVVYETGYNQGIVVVHVPFSDQRPHMMIRDSRTDFFRRYETDKRPMTIGEIREMILANPRFRQLVELELQARGALAGGEGRVEGVIPPYARVITERPVERFLQRYLMGGVVAQTMVIVSPFIGDLAGTPFELRAVTEKAVADRTRLYVITREPRELYHQAGVEVLQQCPLAEIRYNPDIHAKLYVVWSRDEAESFALFGSGNLTKSGLRHNIELGMMIFARGHGRTILRDLYQWGGYSLRTMSQRIKAIESIH